MNQLYPTSRCSARSSASPPRPTRPSSAPTPSPTSAGIHQHGVLANPLTYEIMTPASVGFTGQNIVLGKHSGRRALEHRLIELGHTLSTNELNAVYPRFTELADRKKTIYDQDMLALLTTH